MKPRKLLCGATLAALLVGGTASCSEEEPEPKLPPSSSTPTESSSTPTAEPGEPWEEKSYAGAEAFATHWFDVFSAAMPTGDTAEMREISDPECANCNSTFKTLEGFYEDGGYFRSKGWEVTQATAAKSSPEGRPKVALALIQHPARFKQSATEPEERGGRSTASYVAELRWTDDRWLMMKFEPVR